MSGKISFSIDPNGQQIDQNVTVFPDEMPLDSADLIDCFMAAYVPLKIWKAAAVNNFISKFNFFMLALLDAILSYVLIMLD
jgi:hypothetical protein